MDVEQQQEQAAMEAAFASATGQEPPAAPGPAPAVEAAEPAEPSASAAPEEPPQATDDASPPADAPPAAAEDDDPVLLDGLKRSELHRLLSNAAEVDALKKQLDKAHGSIGDLNRRLQQQQAASSQTPAAVSQSPALPPELAQFEQDYPEIAQYVRALAPIAPPAVTQPAAAQAAPPADAPQPGAAEPARVAPPGPDPMALELAVMDRLHAGWREKIASQDFNLWLTAQGESAQAALHTAQTADDMAAVLGHYDQWAAARSAAAAQTARGQQRLRDAVTPAGGAQRPQAALTEEEAMEAAFRAALGQ